MWLTSFLLIKSIVVWKMSRKRQNTDESAAGPSKRRHVSSDDEDVDDEDVKRKWPCVFFHCFQFFFFFRFLRKRMISK